MVSGQTGWPPTYDFGLYKMSRLSGETKMPYARAVFHISHSRFTRIVLAFMMDAA